MPCKKENQTPPKCVPRQLLETVAIRDLDQEFGCAPISKQFNEPCPSECGSCKCEEDDCGPGVCCASDGQNEEMVKSRIKKEVTSLPREPKCTAAIITSTAVDTITDEIESCQDFLQKLAKEAQDIFQPRNSQQHLCCPQDPQYERYAEKQNKPSGSCSKYTDMDNINQIEPNKRGKPMGQKSNGVSSKKQLDMCGTTCSSLANQSTSKLHAMPCTPTKSLSRNCSVPIAQAVCKVKEGLLCKGVEERLQNKAESKTSFEVTDGTQTPEGKTNKKKSDRKLFQKILGKKRSDCSCDEEMRKQMEEISPNEEEKKKNYKNANSFCDEQAGKNEVGEKGNKNEKAKIERKAKMNSVASNQANTTSKAATACPCCFPPAYNQYFNCTGQVSGNCHCDKSV